MNLQALKKEQIELARKIITKDEFDKIETIGAADQVFYSNKILSYIAVFDNNFNILDQKHALLDVKMPFVRSFQFYREGPAVLEAFNQLETRPDALMVDANGILHPRRIGMASHLGLILGIPTIGIVKNLLCGEVDSKGKVVFNKETRGQQINTREFARPIYISPGHLISIQTSAEISEKSVQQPHKLPEPLHITHKLANKLKKTLIQETPLQKH